MAEKPKKVRYDARKKKKLKIRKRITGSAERPRLTVFRSGKHTYAQVVSDVDGTTLVSASTTEAEIQKNIETATAEFLGPKKDEKEAAEAATHSLVCNATRSTKSVAGALAVGVMLAKRAKEKNITQVVFDRNGYVYQGRVQAVAEAARKAGLDF